MVRYGEVLEGNADDSSTSYLQRKEAIASALKEEIKSVKKEKKKRKKEEGKSCVRGIRLEIAETLKTASEVRT